MKFSLRGAPALIVIASVALVVFVAATITMIRYAEVKRSVDRAVLSSRCRQLALTVAEQGSSAARIGIIRNECEALFAPD